MSEVSVRKALLPLCVIGALALGTLVYAVASAKDDQSPVGDAISSVPIFDAHMHYKEDALASYDAKSIIELMDTSGVAMALVSSTPDEGTIMLWEYAPNRIVPEVRPYRGDITSTNWTKADGIAEYLKERL